MNQSVPKTLSTNASIAVQAQGPERIANGPIVSEGLAATVRDVVGYLVDLKQDAALELAIRLVEDNYHEAAEACPVSEDLRKWQLLAIDLATALEEVDRARSERALALADEIRSTVTIIARNPPDQLSARPSSRRVLAALNQLGGQAGYSEIRRRTGHSPSHFSNILKPLTAYGLVRIEHNPADKRSRVLQLTEEGWQAAPTAIRPRIAEASYDVRIVPGATANGGYSLQKERGSISGPSMLEKGAS